MREIEIRSCSLNKPKSANLLVANTVYFHGAIDSRMFNIAIQHDSPRIQFFIVIEDHSVSFFYDAQNHTSAELSNYWLCEIRKGLCNKNNGLVFEFLGLPQ